jgi:phage gpG-like protein
MANFKDLPEDFKRKANQIGNAFNSRLPKMIGEHFVDGFKKSFDMQKFNDNGSQSWKQVKRRISGQPWFGFNYRTNGTVPSGSRGTYPSGKPRKYGTRGGITNFSTAATTRSILLGSGSVSLRNSIFLYKATNRQVIVASNKPHAQVHNEGGMAKVFGKKEFTMPKRQFMGNSSKLNEEAKPLIRKVIDSIL